jgi:hypothetical protein
LTPFGTEIRELSASKRTVFRALIFAETEKLKTHFKVRLKIEATLVARRLVPLGRGSKPPSVPALSQTERQVTLTTTKLLDYDSKEFQKWLDDNKLRRRKDEVDVEFARRVYLTMAKSFSYKRPFAHDGRASAVCKARNGDCGCLSTVFVSALRANGVPARELVGLHAKSAKSVADAAHAKAEFFAEGVGWVPADPTAGLDDKSAGARETFGNDAGDFLVMHLDGELSFDTIYFGVKPLVRLQGPTFWAVGTGGFEGSKTVESWTVRTIPFLARHHRWEYAVYTHRELMALGDGTARQTLNRLGDQGWELVNVTSGGSARKKLGWRKEATYFLKRRKRE